LEISLIANYLNAFYVIIDMVNVFVERENKYANVKARNSNEIMRLLNINPETVLIVKNNELILAEESLSEKDEVKFLSVISGG